MSAKRYTSSGANKWGIIDGSLSTYEDRYTEKSTGSKIVAIVGLVIILVIVIFCLKWFVGAALAAAIIPGNPFDETDDNDWSLLLITIGVIVSVIGIPLAFILA